MGRRVISFDRNACDNESITASEAITIGSFPVYQYDDVSDEESDCEGTDASSDIYTDGGDALSAKYSTATSTMTDALSRRSIISHRRKIHKIKNRMNRSPKRQEIPPLPIAEVPSGSIEDYNRNGMLQNYEEVSKGNNQESYRESSKRKGRMKGESPTDYKNSAFSSNAGDGYDNAKGGLGGSQSSGEVSRETITDFSPIQWSAKFEKNMNNEDIFPAQRLRFSPDSIAELALSRKNNQQLLHREEEHYPRLENVDYVSTVDLASTNHDLSTFNPITKNDCDSVFNQRIPREIPISHHYRDNMYDDMSSIHPLSQKHSKTKKRSRSSSSNGQKQQLNIHEKKQSCREETHSKKKDMNEHVCIAIQGDWNYNREHEENEEEGVVVEKLENDTKQQHSGQVAKGKSSAKVSDEKYECCFNFLVTDRSNAEIFLITLIAVSLIALITIFLLISIQQLSKTSS